MRRTVLLALLLLTSAAWGDITFDGSVKVPANTIAEVRAKSDDYKSFIYKVTDSSGKKVAVKKGLNGWLYFTGIPGVYTVTATAGKVDKDGNLTLEDAEYTVTIGEPVPPTPPVPPVPPPPPPPPPEPDDAPIKAPGFRVLIVYESATLSKMPAKQSAILYSKALRDWMKASCVTDKDNPNGAFRIWDGDVDTRDESKVWQDAMKRPRKSVPWIIVSNGKSGYEGPLPEDANTAWELMKKYAK